MRTPTTPMAHCDGLQKSSNVDLKTLLYTYGMENLTALINDVKSDDPEIQLNALRIFRKILKIGPNPPFQQVIEARIVPRFVWFLHLESLPQLQYEAVRIFAIFAEKSEYVTLLVDHGVVPGIVNLLLHTPITCVLTREQAILTLGNIARKSPEVCDVIFRNGALEPLLAYLRENKKYTTPRAAIWALRHFCNAKPQMKSEMVNQVLHVLVQHLYSPDEEILVNACWTLASLCDVETSKSQVVIKSAGVFPQLMIELLDQLIELLDHNSPLVVVPALETVANIACGDQMQSQRIIDNGTLPKLWRLLQGDQDNNIKKGACKVVSNIVNGNNHQTQDVVGYGIVYVLVDLFEETSDVEIKQEVARAISTVISHCTNETIKIVSEKCVKPLCDMLEYCSESAHISKCLGCLKSILKVWESDSKNIDFYLQRIEEVEGLMKIRNLRYDDDVAVSDMAKAIIVTYWPK